MKQYDIEAIQLFTEIYSHTLCENGDRSEYPCPQIEKYLASKGIDVRGDE